MAKQIDLFLPPTNDGLVPVDECWFLLTDKKSTAECQTLIFECDGLTSSQWLINAIDQEVLYLSGDQSRRPANTVIDEACRMLFDLTEAGKLFPRSLENVLYQNAWGKGAEAAFNDEAITSNPYAPASAQYAAWSDGYNENQ